MLSLGMVWGGDMATEQVKGLRELEARMKKLGSDIAFKVARSATAAAAQIIKKEAILNIRRNPSIDTGSLLGAVITKKLSARESRLTSEHIVTVRRKKSGRAKGKQATAPYAAMVEFGTVKMKAEAFMRPAFDSKQRAAKDAMVKKLKERIEKVEAGSK